MIELDEWAGFLEASQAKVLPELYAEVRIMSDFMTQRAKDYIGDLQGPLGVVDPVVADVPPWEPLAARTMADKRSLGITKADGAPELRTGEMRASLQPIRDGLTGGTGSDDIVALWQEAGTATNPPRSFIARAVIEGLPLLQERLDYLSMLLLMPKR